MRRLAIIVIILVLFFSVQGFQKPVHASSQRAYQDYLYQFDIYRQRYSEFQIAKNEYQKFNTLTAQASAVDKTRLMLAQRDQLLRAYLLLLKEKIAETPTMSGTDQQTYVTLINNEVSFLDNHSLLVSSVNSLEDATRVSRDLENHYTILQRAIRQTIIGIGLGQLSGLIQDYDIALTNARNVISANPGAFTLEKQATIDRWVLQITNKRTLFQKKYDQIVGTNNSLNSSSIEELNQRFSEMQRLIGESRQEIIDGSSYMKELVNTLRYKD